MKNTPIDSRRSKTRAAAGIAVGVGVIALLATGCAAGGQLAAPAPTQFILTTPENVGTDDTTTLLADPTTGELTGRAKMTADIRTPSTGDIPQSVLQGLPDISTAP